MIRIYTDVNSDLVLQEYQRNMELEKTARSVSAIFPKDFDTKRKMDRKKDSEKEKTTKSLQQKDSSFQEIFQEQLKK